MASLTGDPIVVEARERWKRASEAETAQRERILNAKQFRAGNQWDPAIKEAREGKHSLENVPKLPPRPCLVVDRLSQPVRQVSNVIKTADFGFDVQPNGGGADVDTAKIFKGYMRRVQIQSRGESPIEWAADGAIEGGIGWFRLRADYVYDRWDGDPNDPAVFDQELVLERITNNLSVYCDPAALKPTRADAQFMFITEDLAREEFERQWPEADVASLDDFMTTGDLPGWVDQDTIRIAEYWRITYTNRSFVRGPDGSIREAGDTTKAGDQPADQTPETRVMRVPTVEGYKISATEVLEQWTWVGSRIPIIPVLGEELNVDGKPVLRGIIEEGMDAQKMVNYTYSGAMEIFALGSKSPRIAAAGQIENYKTYWDTANTYNWAYLPYDPIAIAGVAVPPPAHDNSEAPIQAAVMLMRTSEEAIKATTSTGDASLGNSNPNERSGKALQALQQQSDLANSNYPDNVRRALIYAAEQMVEVIPKITRPGQIVSLMGEDDEPEQVMVGQPFQPPAQKGAMPQASPPGITPTLAKLSRGLHKFYDLNQGRYAVTVTVGKAVSTRREEGAIALGALIPHLPPQMAAVATPDYVEQLNFDGAHKIAEKLRKTLPPELQEPDPNAPPIPPEVKQQLAQMQQQLQQAAQAIQTDQAKQQATIEKAKIDAQAMLQKTQMEQQAAVAKAKIEAQAKQQQLDMEADKELALQVMKNANSISVAHIAAAAKGAAIAAHATEEAQALGHEAQQADLDRSQTASLAAQEALQAPIDTGMSPGA